MSVSDSENALLTLPEASRLLRIKVSTLRAWRTQRRLTFVKLNGRLLLRRIDLQKFIEASIVPAVEAAK